MTAFESDQDFICPPVSGQLVPAAPPRFFTAETTTLPFRGWLLRNSSFRHEFFFFLFIVQVASDAGRDADGLDHLRYFGARRVRRGRREYSCADHYGR